MQVDLSDRVFPPTPWHADAGCCGSTNCWSRVRRRTEHRQPLQ